MKNLRNKLVLWLLNVVRFIDPNKTERLRVIAVGRRAATSQLTKHDPVLAHEVLWAFNELERLEK